ncbi:MAG: S41 family peptidase [Acidimicrobiia bacterium]
MHRCLLVALALIGACSSTTGSATTESAAPTSEVPATTTTSTTEADQEYEVLGCSSPPVTFSALCQIYRLAQNRHVDRPVSTQDLAALALEGLATFETPETEAAPRTLFCAIPDDAFIALCDQLAWRVGETGLPVAPAMEAATAAMANLGLGPFSYYVPPAEAAAFRADGLVGGVGILLDATDAAGSKCIRIADSCPLEIVFVLEDNPGDEAGLVAGDLIITVDGVPVEGRGFTDIASELAGDETGEVSITVQRQGLTLPLIVQRGDLDVPTVEIARPAEGVAYLKIPDFEEDIPQLVRDALAAVLEPAADILVIDLRDNPGGYIHSAVEVASEFIDGGLVLTEIAPDGSEEHFAEPGVTATGQRLVVMVNEGTASAAEILAGALRDRRDAVVVGTDTFGKDAVQIAFPLNNGGELYLAVARWITPDGHGVGPNGLTPDHRLDWSATSTLEEAVAAALEAAS